MNSTRNSSLLTTYTSCKITKDQVKVEVTA